ncbi:amidase domain-containing protein [Clostridium perfringens]|uniref:amidase domain-containing protein n=1 Tax=Clostridium perfringens TaxID=1502 RepID=UPI0039ED2141
MKIVKRKKFFLVSLISFFSVLLFTFGSIKFVYADGKDLTNDEQLKSSIHEFLLNFFDLSISKEPVDCSKYINDKKLANLYNDDFNSFIESNKEHENTKLTIDITEIKQKKENEFLVAFTLRKDYQIIGANVPSSEIDKYFAKIDLENNKFYINKIISEFEYIQFTSKDVTSKFSRKALDYSSIYDDVINNKIRINEEFKAVEDEVISKLRTQTIDEENVNSRKYYGYNAGWAVDYAYKYWENYNPGFVSYENIDSDCQNFVSQCVYAGEVPMTRYWHHYVNSDYSLDITKSWSSVTHFYDYIKKNGYTWGDDYYHNWRWGDVVQFYNPAKKKYSHSVILTGTKGNGTSLYTGHTKNVLNGDMEDAIKRNKYSKWRYIKFWH